MNGSSITKDQDLSGDMPLEMLEKLDHLRALDAAVVDLKIEPPEGQAANDRKTLPVEGFLEHGRLPVRSPGAHSGWAVCSVRFHRPGARLVAASSASVGFFVMSMPGKK